MEDGRGETDKSSSEKHDCYRRKLRKDDLEKIYRESMMQKPDFVRTRRAETGTGAASPTQLRRGPRSIMHPDYVSKLEIMLRGAQGREVTSDG